MKFNISDIHVSWKGYIIGNLPLKINIHLMAYKKNRLLEVVNPWKLSLALTEVHVVTFQQCMKIPISHFLGKVKKTCRKVKCWSQIDYKQQNKVRKIYLFSNIKTLSDMLKMQDFALNISKFSCERHVPKPSYINLADFAGLNGKVKIWKGK